MSQNGYQRLLTISGQYWLSDISGKSPVVSAPTTNRYRFQEIGHMYDLSSHPNRSQGISPWKSTAVPWDQWGLATQGNLDFGSFDYMYKQRFSHATLVIAKINRKKVE
ncbi:hypothetical protein B0H11DRAFT_1934507 [Mycena galericulata]|nr:hypothetical protein B0H11DRAFT_1934507 [Mycena galericulata]